MNAELTIVKTPPKRRSRGLCRLARQAHCRAGHIVVARCARRVRAFEGARPAAPARRGVEVHRPARLMRDLPPLAAELSDLGDAGLTIGSRWPTRWRRAIARARCESRQGLRTTRGRVALNTAFMGDGA
jgi:hypothetical protein